MAKVKECGTSVPSWVISRFDFRDVEAIQSTERQTYDVVLMDVQMPEMDGLDASRRICSRWPAESRPRIIAMTANAMIEDREACFAAGMDDYLAKPVRSEELADALGRVRTGAGT